MNTELIEKELAFLGIIIKDNNINYYSNGEVIAIPNTEIVNKINSNIKNNDQFLTSIWEEMINSFVDIEKGIAGNETTQRLFINTIKNFYNLCKNSKKLIKSSRIFKHILRHDINDFNEEFMSKIKNTNYTINKIIDWSPNTFCKIELLKLADNYLKYKKKIYDPNQSRINVNIITDRPPQKVIDMSRPEMSAPIYLDGDGNPVYQGDTEVTPPVYYNNRTNIYDPKSNVIVIGSGNILNNSLNSYIVGDDNYININKEGVIIFGKNNNIS